MKRWMMVMALFASACSGGGGEKLGTTNDSVTKAEAKAMGGVDADGDDICEYLNWYGDDVCDDFCPNPDADCELATNNLSTNNLSTNNLSTNNVSGADCGGLAGLTCATGQFCNYPDDSFCGAADQLGTCEPRPEVCTEEFQPVCGCDGNDYSNSCSANAAGTDVASDGACGGAGCAADSDCAVGQVCVAGVCEVAAGCSADSDCAAGEACVNGVCEEQTAACAADSDCAAGQVCVNGVCEASTTCTEDADCGAGESCINGVCVADTICGGFAGFVCAAGQFCDWAPTDMCGAADQTGICQPIPQACPDVVLPVCGCDGMTYGNSCEANAAGISVAADGACKTSCTANNDCAADELCINGVCEDIAMGQCGGFAGFQCAADEWCDYPDTTTCGAADQIGACKVRPQACITLFAPVCGCDGQTYSNECMANAAGVDISMQGACPI